MTPRVSRSRRGAPHQPALADDLEAALRAEVRRAVANIYDAGRELAVVAKALENTAGETSFEASSDDLYAQAVLLRAHAEAALGLVATTLQGAGRLAGLAVARESIESHDEGRDGA